MGVVDVLLYKLTSYILQLSLGNILVGCVFMLVVMPVTYILTRKKGKNPFLFINSKPRKELITDKSKRDAVLKQRFLPSKVPSNLDAIVIGSGIGGMSCAALLAKAGKKVLVLEQHDQAGGCCHTFIEKGFEFDVGIHYVGEVEGNTLTQTYLDQITDGNLAFSPVNDVIDIVELQSQDGVHSSHKIVKGRDEWMSELKRTFPNEHEGIDKFFADMRKARKVFPHLFILKMIPLWFSRFILKTGIFHIFSDLPKLVDRSLKEYLDEITGDDRLKAVLSYSYGDYGTQPRESPLLMHLMLMQHYTYGGYYPVGGASEIAFNIIPTIEKSGGKVYVNAVVENIIVENGKAIGVNVKRKADLIAIHAPIVISAAGITNTYKNMISDSVQCKPNLEKLFKHVKSGPGTISIYVGFDQSNEELGLQATNTWAFTDIDLDKALDDFMALPVDALADADVPILFISFPSTKDPTWNKRFPGKSNCTVITFADWDWFGKWENEKLKHRGEEYETLKRKLAEKCWEQTLRFYPQLRDKQVYFEAGSPLSNKYYIGSNKGEIYGLDHTLDRFNLEVCAQLRPVTQIPGLYLTGQDVTTAGFAGALYSGLITAAAILNRNLMDDLIAATKEVRVRDKNKSKKSE